MLRGPPPHVVQNRELRPRGHWVPYGRVCASPASSQWQTQSTRPLRKGFLPCHGWGLANSVRQSVETGIGLKEAVARPGSAPKAGLILPNTPGGMVCQGQTKQWMTSQGYMAWLKLFGTS